MRLTDEQVKGFQKIYKEKFGHEISDTVRHPYYWTQLV